MDARTNIEARLPSRPAAERYVGTSAARITPELFKKPKPLKKPRYILDSKPRSRHVAKDMLEFAGIPIFMTTLRGHCTTVAAPAVTENLKPRKWKSHADA
jgi:hypothetical protein